MSSKASPYVQEGEDHANVSSLKIEEFSPSPSQDLHSLIVPQKLAIAFILNEPTCHIRNNLPSFSKPLNIYH